MIERLFSLLYQSEVSGKVVIKRYSIIKGIKWVPAKLLLPFYPYALSPSERASREATFLLSDLPTPKLIAIGKNFIIREYLEGEVLGPKPREVALAIWEAHKRGWALGDAKYDNFLVKDGELYYIDGEQALRDPFSKLRFADVVVGGFFLMLSLGCKGLREFWEAYPDEEVKAKALKFGITLLFPCVLELEA